MRQHHRKNSHPIRGILAAALAVCLAGAMVPGASAADPRADAGRVTIQPSTRVAGLVSQMTLAEKLSFVVNNVDPELITSAGYIPGVARLGIPPLRLADGTAGIRTGTGIAQTATAMPVPTMLASTFDPELAYAYGAAIGEEGRALSQDVLLAPMINVIRVPQGGRNFETFSEDPLVTSAIAASEVTGVQDAGMIATAKHYALNNQEANKTQVSANLSDQAFHEVYLPGYAAAVDAGAGAVMSAYNKVNGTFSASNSVLLNDILKDELGFDGWVMSDWGTAHDPTDMNAGLDQAMFWPDSQANRGYFLPSFMEPALADGTVPMAALDDAVARIVGQMERFGLLDGAATDRPSAAAASTKAEAVAQDVAEAGAVLLKNDAILPLSEGGDIAVFGLTADEPKVGGSGSASMEPGAAQSPLTTLRERAGASATVTWASGIPSGAPIPLASVVAGAGSPAFPFDAAGNIVGSGAFMPPFVGTLTVPETGSYTFNADIMGIANLQIDGNTVAQGMGSYSSGTVYLTAGDHSILLMATGQGRLTWITPSGVAAAFADVATRAAAADKAIVFAYDQTAVMADRTSLTLPSGQDGLIEAVPNANPNTIVVLNTGSALTMPWLGKVKAVLDMYYPGQKGAEATARLLYGDANPSGKLTQTFPASDSQTPIAGDLDLYPGLGDVTTYREGIDAGYRWYARHKVEPLFPFGFGLSYTTFSYADPVASQDGDTLTATVKLTNTGYRAGTEVVQVYAGPTPGVDADQPVRKLVGFAKVELGPGASQTVEIPIDIHQFEYWDSEAGAWKLAEGSRRLAIGGSSDDAAVQAIADVTDPSTPAPDLGATSAALLKGVVGEATDLDATAYTAETWAAVAAALSAAAQLLTDASATDSQRLEAALGLVTAIGGLQPRASGPPVPGDSPLLRQVADIVADLQSRPGASPDPQLQATLAALALALAELKPAPSSDNTTTVTPGAVRVKAAQSTLVLAKGKSQTVPAYAYTDAGTAQRPTWASSNTKVATVNAKGKIVAKGVGKATITVKATGANKATIKVKVVSAAAAKSSSAAGKSAAVSGLSSRMFFKVSLMSDSLGARWAWRGAAGARAAKAIARPAAMAAAAAAAEGRRAPGRVGRGG
ncbi:MAG: glycoside hydrolase family 3 C-terminal domain-containing protein, partial [Bifidobacteriaceae bacterium]|nr:glycoside hydrolase family 3 C-terminal domain-containing protein [Bifidobacteriaceae bacterium]